MKLIIDTETDSKEQLKLASSFLLALSEGRHDMHSASSSAPKSQEFTLPSEGLSFMDIGSLSQVMGEEVKEQKEEMLVQEKKPAPKIEFF